MRLPFASPNAAVLTDWLETHVMFSAEHEMSRSAFRDLLEEDPSLERLRGPARRASANAREPEDALLGGTSSELASDTFAEFRRRSRIVGASYPFSVEREFAALRPVTWREPEALLYAFLLATSQRYVHKLNANFHVAAELFEQLVVYALRALWVTPLIGGSVRFGAPRGPEWSTTAPIADLAKSMGLRCLRELSAPSGDAGLDVVAWRELDDRPSTASVLCQCAVGEDWERKSVELSEWQLYLAWNVAPTRAVAFPFVPEATKVTFDRTHWEVLAARCGLPLDRLRVAALIDTAIIPAPLCARLEDWVAGIEPQLHELLE